MTLTDLLTSWIARRQLRPATKARFRHELAMWRRLGGDENPTETDVSAWQQRAIADGLRPRTINSVCASVSLLAKNVGGASLAWQPLPVRIQPKHTPTVADLDRLLATAQRAARRSAEWWQRLLCVAYATGVRRSDLLRLDVSQVVDGELSIVAGKTEKRQVIPIPPAVLRLLPASGHICRVGIKPLRRVLCEWCQRAGVQTITPQAIRRLSAREWERAHAGAGAVILGHDVPGWTRATAAYIDRADLLRAGLSRLRLPASLMDATAADDIENLTAEIKRLTDQQRETVKEVVSAMAR